MQRFSQTCRAANDRGATGRARRGFTLVELLVVIGIIALLIGILLPSLIRARVNARRIQDVSGIHQMAVAVVNYAANFKGTYPVGTHGSFSEDLAWTNNATADYLIQFCNGSANVWTDLDANPQMGRVLSCNAIFDNAKSFGLLTTAYYASYNEEQMGWIYWGGRYYSSYADYSSATPTPFQPTIVNRNGTTGGPYTMPLRQGDHPTTRTLFTCFSYLSPVAAYTGIVPHQVNGNSIAQTLSGTSAYQFVTLMAGMSMSCTDGSARFVPAGDIGAIQDLGGSWYYYDAKANN